MSSTQKSAIVCDLCGDEIDPNSAEAWGIRIDRNPQTLIKAVPLLDTLAKRHFCGDCVVALRSPYLRQFYDALDELKAMPAC